MSILTLRQPRRRIALAAALAAAFVYGGIAVAQTPQPAIQTSTPRLERQITNIDVLRQQIRNYYGDPLGTGTFADESNYADEARSVAERGERWLEARAHFPDRDGQKAIIVDVDDTALSTWNYELSVNWAFTPQSQAVYVNGQLFQPVPGMVEMAQEAQVLGYAVIFLTGRGAAQEDATLGNLTSDGIGVDAEYPDPTTLNDGEDGLFTKPAVANYPDYLQAACAGDPNGSCTTIHYKAATRAHIESLGYDIVANFGDQFSDLEGGFADRTFKLPNPNYFLP
jgi:hypothetical protein